MRQELIGFRATVRNGTRGAYRLLCGLCGRAGPERATRESAAEEARRRGFRRIEFSDTQNQTLRHVCRGCLTRIGLP